MDIDGHDIASMLFIGFVSVSGLLTIFGNRIEHLLFLISFILFSTKLNPDIDLKLPYIPHRGITHNHYGVLILSSIIIFILIYGLPYFNITLENKIVYSTVFGAAIAWLIHAHVDWLHQKLENLSWLVIFTYILIGFYFLAK